MPDSAPVPDSAASPALPVVRLRGDRRRGHPGSAHPWIFQKLVERPSPKPRPGQVVDIVDRDGVWFARGFYNGHSRIALRILTTDPDEAIDAAFFDRRIADAVRLRRDILDLDAVSNGWRAFHAEGDGISGLIVDRYDDLLVVEYFSAGAYRHREWIHTALHRQFPGCRIHGSADPHVQKQESFDLRAAEPPAPALIVEHGVKFLACPGSGHKTGFFADQRDNREFLSRFAHGARVLDLCCNSGGFALYAAVRGGASEVTGVDLDGGILEVAARNARLNDAHVRFVQADVFPWLRQAAERGERYDVVVLDPAKMTRDRDEVVPALKKYLDMNKLALSVVRDGGIFASFSCTGLVSEEQFLDMLRRAAFYAGRGLQVLRVAGAGADHPFMGHAPEGRYLKAAFCRVI